jgi:serine/threonine protein kinase
MPLSPGDKLGPYEILAPIGAGGMGEVYKARDTRLNRDVAVKVLMEEFALSSDRRARFEREARAVAALSHSNIVALYDIGEQSGQLYMVNELIAGENLRERLRDGALTVRETLDIGSQIADGIATAHEAGITHRDLKPENLILTSAKTVKILDFGLARVDVAKPIAPTDRTRTVHHQTQPGTVMGTPYYMSPEQARGLDTDYRSDQFSLGVILHEMLTGKQAFRRASIPETMIAILKEDAPPLDASVPAPLRWIVERLLAKDAADRYVATRDLSRELRALRDRLSELTSVSDTAPTPIPSPPVRGRRLWPFLLTSSAAGFAAALALLRIPDVGNDESRYRFSTIARDHSDQYQPVWSPDSKSIAYCARVKGVYQVFVRTAGSPNAAQITHGVQSCSAPFWSPDGTTIFYRSAGDWWAIGALGGAPQKAFNSENAAAIHPDGKTLALTRHGKLFIGRANESEQKEYRHPLFPSNSWIGTLNFSPDGSRLAVIVAPAVTVTNRFEGSQAADLWILPWHSGGNPQKLANIPRVHSVEWFPDNRHLLFQRDDGENSSLVRLDTRTGQSRIIWTTAASIDSCSLSRDGKRIALSLGETRSEIVEVSLFDGRLSTLLERRAGAGRAFAEWAPSGTHYLYTTGSPAAIEDRSVNEDFVRTVVTKQSEGIPPNMVAFAHPRWSPDGNRVVFDIGFGSGAATRQLWVSSLSGHPFPLTGARHGWGASWSPDGEWISYLSYGDDVGVHLSKIRVSAGASPVILSTDLAANSLGVTYWSPSGEWILYPGKDGIALVSSDGKTHRALSPKSASALGFSKHGDLIYAIRRENMAWRLFSIDVKSRAEKQLATVDFPPDLTNLSSFSLHPEGNRFVVSINRWMEMIYELQGFDQPKSWLDWTLGR